METCSIAGSGRFGRGLQQQQQKELPPAELTDFKEEVVLQKQWSRSIGDGQGKTYNMLVPAVEGNNIYAADVTGVVMSLDRMNGDVEWKKTSNCLFPAQLAWAMAWSCSAPCKVT